MILFRAEPGYSPTTSSQNGATQGTGPAIARRLARFRADHLERIFAHSAAISAGLD